ncbi:hypothetical protein RUM43_013696, partial [Polyplax serrata]
MKIRAEVSEPAKIQNLNGNLGDLLPAAEAGAFEKALPVGGLWRRRRKPKPGLVIIKPAEKVGGGNKKEMPFGQPLFAGESGSPGKKS